MQWIKMADGNIVVANAEYLDEIDYDTNLMYFNTKKGSFTETSYERLKDKYDVEESWEDCILYKKYVDWLGENKSWKKQYYYWQAA